MKELINIQSALKAPKNQFNAFGRYHYRSAEDILEAVKPLLSQQKCVLILTDDAIRIGERYYIKSTATITNQDGASMSASGFAREDESKKGMDGAQLTGSTSSYSRKYALNGLFCIDDNKDSDMQTNTTEQTKKITIAEAMKRLDEVNTREDLVALWNQCNIHLPGMCNPGSEFYEKAQAISKKLK